GLGSSAFARRYWRNHYCFLFLQVLRWFTSLRCLLTAYVFSGGSFGISQRGFPHSEIPGSKLICSSPGLIAAYRVLHRLLVPRHSPYTLSSLTLRNSTNACLEAGRLSPPTSTHAIAFMHTACVWSEKLPFAGYSVVKESASLYLAIRRSGGWRSRDHHITKSKNLVENTGLEPVTSWLQTRRSPS